MQISRCIYVFFDQLEDEVWRIVWLAVFQVQMIYLFGHLTKCLERIRTQTIKIAYPFHYN